MNIEPLSSVMTLQSQQMPMPKPVESAERTGNSLSQNAAAPGAAPDLAAVQTVENVSEPSADGGGQGRGNQQNSDYQEEIAATSERLKEAVARFNKSSGANSEAVFGIHEGTNRVTIKIVDKKTKETIKELPPEKTLDMIAKVWEMAGIMVDEKR
ncbi:flagellar protein FlaG [Lachnospiraceae bacterium XBB2008]|nr:flagellar protein FlaG [Lachnospiraceae bacterium XBB2008]